MKRNKFVRILSVLLTVAMVLGAFPQTAFAAEVKRSTEKEMDYTITQKLSDDKTRAEIELKIKNDKERTLQEVILPDGTVKKAEADKEENTISYEAADNGELTFVMKYLQEEAAKEEKIFYEVTEIEQGKPETPKEIIPGTEVVEEPQIEEPQTEEAQTEEAQQSMPRAVVSGYTPGSLKMLGVELSTDPSGGTDLKSNSTLGFNAKLSVQDVNTEDGRDGYTNLDIGYRFTLPVPAGKNSQYLTFLENSYSWLKNTDGTSATPTWDAVNNQWVLEGIYRYNAEDGLGSGAAQEYTRAIAIKSAWMLNGDSSVPSMKAWIVEDGQGSGKQADAAAVTIVSEPKVEHFPEQLTNSLTGWYSQTTGTMYKSRDDALNAGAADAKMGSIYIFSETLWSGKNEGNEKFKSNSAITGKVKVSVSTPSGVDTTPDMQPVLIGAYFNGIPNGNAYTGSGASADLTYDGRVSMRNSGSGTAVSFNSLSFSNNTLAMELQLGESTEQVAQQAFYHFFVPADDLTGIPQTRTLTVQTTDFTAVGESDRNYGKIGEINDKVTAVVPAMNPGNPGMPGAYNRETAFSDLGGGWINKMPVNSDMNIRGGVQNKSSELFDEIGAFDYLVKFDGEGVLPRDAAPAAGTSDYKGGTVTYKYGVLPDGGNWSSDDAMESTRKDGIVFYETLAEAQGHGTVVAFLAQVRGGRMSMGWQQFVFPIKSADATKANKVYQTVADVYLWKTGENPETELPSRTMFPTDDPGGYAKDVWQADGTVIPGTGEFSGDSVLLTAYGLSTDHTEVLNGSDRVATGAEGNGTFDITAGERIATVQYTYKIVYDGESAAEPETPITFSVGTGRTSVNANIVPLMETARLNAVYTQGTNPGDAGFITGGITPDSTTLAADGFSGSAAFTVNKSGTYTVTMQYRLGDAIDPTKDLAIGRYNVYQDILLTGQSNAFVSMRTGARQHANFVITKSTAAGFKKSVVDNVVAKGESVKYVLTMSSNNRDLNGTFGLDILPFNGDDRGTNLSGGYTVEPVVTTIRNDNPADPMRSALEIYYTTDTAIQSLPLKTAKNFAGITMTDGMSVLGCTWHKAAQTMDGKVVTSTIPGGKATAIVLAGTIASKESPTTIVALTPDSYQAGDAFGNTAAIYSPDLIEEMGSTSPASSIATRQIKGTAWADTNKNGAQDAGEDGIEGLSVKLWLKDGTQITEDNNSDPYNVVTDADGNYVYEDVPSSDQEYYVTFESGTTLLKQYVVTEKAKTGVDADKNSDVNAANDADGFLNTATTDPVQLMTLQQQKDNKIPVAIQQLDAGFVPAYVVDFDTKGGSTAPDSQIVVLNDKVVKPVDPIRTDYTFGGWYTDDTYTTAWDFDNGMVTGDMTLYAKWDRNPHKVTFETDTNGGFETGAVTEVVVDYGDSLIQGQIPATKPNAGYEFDKWVDKDGNTITDLTNYPITSNTTVKAIFKTKGFQVKYDTDGGTPGAIDAKTVQYSDAGLLPVNQPTKAGHTFEGWKCAEAVVTGETKYSDLVADDTVTEVTLKAQWKSKAFTATWKTADGETAGSINGGTQTQAGILYGGNATKDILVDLASDQGEAVFIGWDYTMVPDRSTIPVTGFVTNYKAVNVMGDITFVAKFASTPFVKAEAVNGKITVAKGETPDPITSDTTGEAQFQFEDADNVDLNPGTVIIQMAANMHHHLEGITIKDYKGHTYTFTAADIISGEYEVGDKSPLSKIQVTFNKAAGTILIKGVNTSLSITASFAEDPKYKVEFFTDKEDPASLVWTNQDLYAGNFVGDKPDTDPTKVGYVFGGWSTDGTAAPDKMYNSNTEIVDSNIAYYAVWTAKEYQVQYDLAGGSAEPQLSGKAVGFFDKDLLPKDTEYKKTGYTFTGWTYDKTEVTADTAYNDLVADDTVTAITLTAVWAPISYEVLFHKQAADAEGTMAAQPFQYDEEKPLTANSFTNAGYAFAGWATKEGGAIVYEDGKMVKNLTDTEGTQVTLYAVWNAKGDTPYAVEHYKQKADGNYGITADEIEMLTGQTDTNATAAVKTYESYVFDENADQNVLQGMISGDGKLVLKLYYRMQITVSFDSDGGNYIPKDQIMFLEEKAVKPEDPTRSGYTFGGWYLGDAKWDFDTKVTQSMTLKAKWSANAVTPSPGKTTPSKPSYTGNVKTGDTMDLKGYGILFAISGLAFAAVLFGKKRRKKEN